MKKKVPYLKILVGIGFFFILVFNVFPYLALILGSLLPNSKIDRGVSLQLLDSINIKNFSNLGGSLLNYWPYLKNSLYVSLSTAFLVLLSSFCGAYGVTRYRFRGRRLLQHSAFLGYLLPPILLVIPYMVILRIFDIYGTLLGLVIANVAFCFPFGFWLMIQYFEHIPTDFDKTAAIDGANWYQALIYVLLPRAIPGASAVAMFSFILSWNDVALSHFLISDQTNKPLAVGFKENILDIAPQSSYGSFAAVSLIFASMAIVIFGLIQHYVDSSIRNEAEELNK